MSRLNGDDGVYTRVYSDSKQLSGCMHERSAKEPAFDSAVHGRCYAVGSILWLYAGYCRCRTWEVVWKLSILCRV